MCIRRRRAASIALCLVFMVQTKASKLHNAAENVAIDVIEEHSPREKRSLDGALAENIKVRLTLGSGDVELRLKRQPLVETLTPDGVTHRGNLYNSGVYTDASTAFIVKREAGEFRLNGVFAHQGAAMELSHHMTKRAIWPWRKSSFRWAGHTVQKTSNDVGDISFLGDTAVDADDHNAEEIINLRHENHMMATVLQDEGVAMSASTEPNVVEMSFIVDFTDFTWFSTYYNNVAVVDEIRTWYTYVANQINIRYQSINSIKISTKVIKLLILGNTPEERFITNLGSTFDGGVGLTKLSEYVELKDQTDLPTSDHYMYFTRNTINGAAGIAFRGTACTFSGVSISTNNGQASLGAIAAHELGHSLNSRHDALESGGCTDNDQFIMSTVLQTPVDAGNAGNNFKFSSCSINAFTSYLNGKQCTLPANTGNVNDLPAPPFGQVLDNDAQCKLRYGDQTTFWCKGLQESAQVGGIETICRAMYCDIPNGNGFCSGILPQEYTPCGTSKWCVKGLCVTKTAAPTTAAPTTPAPTTPAPTTAAPTTPAPTTPAPTTPAPTTATPSTPSPFETFLAYWRERIRAYLKFLWERRNRG